MGYETGIDLPLLIATASKLPELIGLDIPSQIVKAGRRLDLQQLPSDFDEIQARALSRVD